MTLMQILAEHPLIDSSLFTCRMLTGCFDKAILYFSDLSDVILQSSSFNDEKIMYKHYNKWIATYCNGNVQTHDQEENKLNSTIDANIGAQTLTWDKIIKSPFFHVRNVAEIKCGFVKLVVIFFTFYKVALAVHDENL